MADSGQPTNHAFRGLRFFMHQHTLHAAFSRRPAIATSQLLHLLQDLVNLIATEANATARLDVAGVGHLAQDCIVIGTATKLAERGGKPAFLDERGKSINASQGDLESILVFRINAQMAVANRAKRSGAGE